VNNVGQEPREIDPFDLAAQQEAKIRKDDVARLERANEVEDLKWLMAYKQGRRIVWRQLEKYGVFRSVFRNDPLEMAFLEGIRNQGLQLIADIHEHCPARYAEMIKEQKEYGRELNKRAGERNSG
jgi:hypothetical protein